MKKYSFALVPLLFLAFSALMALRNLPTAYEIGEDYRIEFESDNPSGSFAGLEGNIHFDKNDLQGSFFDVAVDASTINTGNGLKNKHARAKGYFDTDEFPKIEFRSTQIEKLEEGFLLKGILKMKGQEKQIEFPFQLLQETDREVFQGEFSLNRLDYGIGPDAASPSHELKVSLYVPVRPK